MDLKKLLFKKRSLFTSWLLSYAFILCVSVVIGTIVYIQTQKVVENEINRGSIALLKQTQVEIDGKMQEIEALSQRIALNPRVLGFLNVKPPLQGEGSYRMAQICSDFVTYEMTNNFMDSFYVYFKNSDLVLAPQGYSANNILYESLHGETDLSYEDWQAMVAKVHERDCFALQDLSPDKKAGRTIVYSQSLPLHDSRQALANIVVVMNESKFINSIQKANWIEDAQFMIIDRNGRIMASSSPYQASIPLEYGKLTGSEGVINDSLNGRKVAVSYVTSPYMGWKYVYAIPVSIFREKVAYVQRLTILALVLYLLLGGVIAFILARRNYSPIRNLVKGLANKTPIHGGERYREYQAIQEMIDTTLSEKKRIQDEKNEIFGQLERLNPVLRSNFLMRLLKGKIDDKICFEDVLSSFGIHFHSQYFAVILLFVDDFEEMFSMESQDSEMEKVKLVQFVITNVVEELAGRNHQGFMADVDDMMVCLINLDSGRMEQGEVEILKIAEEAQCFLKEKANIRTTLSISDIHETPAMIPKAYQQALEAMEYKVISGRGNIIKYSDIKPSGQNYYYPMDLEQQLINTIKEGDFDTARALLEDVFEHNVSRRVLSIQMAKCFMFGVVNTMIKTMDEISIVWQHSFFEKLDPVERLLKCNTIMEMKTEILDILSQVCEFIKNSKKRTQNDSLKGNIIKYIEDHYNDSNLCIASIADNFNMNPVPLSRFFKEHMGQGLLDYINKVRLDKAKELLRQNEWSIADIAKEVGYYHSSAFIRAFKKYERLTPGKYKEMMIHKP